MGVTAFGQHPPAPGGPPPQQHQMQPQQHMPPLLHMPLHGEKPTILDPDHLRHQKARHRGRRDESDESLDSSWPDDSGGDTDPEFSNVHHTEEATSQPAEENEEDIVNELLARWTTS